MKLIGSSEQKNTTIDVVLTGKRKGIRENDGWENMIERHYVNAQKCYNEPHC